MSLDRTTESIAHFVGLFDTAIEEARLRNDYLEFKSLKAKEEDASDYAFGPVRISVGYTARDYDPTVKYTPKQDLLTPDAVPAIPDATPLNAPYSGAGVGAPPQPPGPVQPDFGGTFKFLPFVPIPSSAVTVTFQSIFLHDDDTMGDPELAGFQSVEVFHAALDTAIALAEALLPWAQDGLAADVLEDPAAAVAFLNSLETIEAPDIDGVSISIVADQEAHNIFINGEKADEIPDLDDYLPAFIKAKHDNAEAAETAAEEEDPLAGQSKDDPGLFESHQGWLETFATSGHNVVAGANETHNGVDIYTSWIDADVFAVGGDVINLNVISQINILSDHGHANGNAHGGATGPSQAFNIAEIAVNALKDEAEGNTEAAPAGSAGLPDVWNMETIDGDVTVTNLIKQFTYATDNDQLDLTFTANSTMIVAGENQTYNFAHAGEYGFGYDLIIVGGSMVSMNVISQTNVLLDNDYFSGMGMGAASVSGNDNLLWNEATITEDGADTQIDMLQEFKDTIQQLADGATDLAQTVVENALFEGLEALKVLYIEGDLTQMNIVDQINYLGDQDQIHMAQDAMMSALDNSPVSFTTGSNLMTNTAAILESGFDSQIMADGEYYNDALLYQAELIDTDADPLGVSVASLASEAVAFLADDMIAGTVSDTLEAAGLGNDGHAGGTAFDVMQTMTA